MTLIVGSLLGAGELLEAVTPVVFYKKYCASIPLFDTFYRSRITTIQ